MAKLDRVDTHILINGVVIVYMLNGNSHGVFQMCLDLTGQTILWVTITAVKTIMITFIYQYVLDLGIGIFFFSSCRKREERQSYHQTECSFTSSVKSSVSVIVSSVSALHGTLARSSSSFTSSSRVMSVKQVTVWSQSSCSLNTKFCFCS